MTSQEHIVFLDRSTFRQEVELVRPRFEHRWTTYNHTSPSEVLERLATATVAITNKVMLRSDTIAALPHLKMIAVAATGYDCVDVPAAKKHGLMVSNVRGYAVHTVPEHVFALILSLQRSLIPYRQSVLNGRWQESGNFCYFDYPIADLHGRTLGIFGEGMIGKAVANIAQAFGMKVLFADHKGASGWGPLYTPFDEVIKTADILTVHAPLSASTRHMIGTREFDMMQQRPVIVNTSRGGLIDETALVKALHDGRIRGFAFDVLTSEPPSPDNPILSVLTHPHVIVTPHVAWASVEAQNEVWRQVVACIEGYHHQQPIQLL